jgi:hypothetical protein
MSSNVKHTPGPWKACPPRFGHQFVRQDPINWDGQGYQHICTLPQSNKGTYYGEMFEANANLIAAAPEMHGAVIEADGCFEAALAEGWLEALADGDIERIRDLWDRRLSYAHNLFPEALAKANGESNDATNQQNTGSPTNPDQG